MAEAVLHELFDTILGPKLSYTDRVSLHEYCEESVEQNVAQVDLDGPSSKNFGRKCGSSRFTWTF